MTAARVARAVRSVRAWLVVFLVAALAGCSSFSNPFGPERPKPKDLEPIAMIDNKVAGKGWSFLDSLYGAHKIPLKKRD